MEKTTLEDEQQNLPLQQFQERLCIYVIHLLKLFLDLIFNLFLNASRLYLQHISLHVLNVFLKIIFFPVLSYTGGRNHVAGAE